MIKKSKGEGHRIESRKSAEEFPLSLKAISKAIAHDKRALYTICTELPSALKKEAARKKQSISPKEVKKIIDLLYTRVSSLTHAEVAELFHDEGKVSGFELIARDVGNLQQQIARSNPDLYLRTLISTAYREYCETMEIQMKVPK